MKFSHRRLEISVRKFCIRHFYYFISFLFGVTSITFFLIGGGLAYNFFSTGVRTNQVKIEVLEKKVEKLESEQINNFNWIAVTEKHFGNWLLEAKAGNEAARQKQIQKLIDELEKK